MVTVRFFAFLKGMAGVEAKEYAVTGTTTVEKLKDRIKTDFPGLARILESRTLLVSVNQEFATKNTPVKDGDEVAFLPPFSGG